MIYAAYVPSREDLVAEQAFRIAWDYLVCSGYEDCVPHQVAVVGYINEQIDRGVRHKLILANRAIAAFAKAKAEFAGQAAWGAGA
jgi:hypothetical protein